MSQIATRARVAGVFLALLYTGLISSADGITKFIAGGYAAPQLYALSGGLVALFCLLADRVPGQRAGFRTTQPVAMTVRCISTVIAATCFFYAFRLLPFAEVFVFVGMMPIFAGLLSGPILGERASVIGWLALAAGFAGVLCLFPEGLTHVTPGHLVALGAAAFGTLSMMMARYIGRFERNSLAQVLYPNLAVMAVMALALPFVWRPMPLSDLMWAGAYAAFLFSARWVLVVALRLLPAFAVTPLMNLQFVWMVGIGALVFGEVPGAHIYLGVTIVVGAGCVLIYEQFARPVQRPAAALAE